jgi:sigma-54 dependent transcriptional regulator, gfr operon transcriptional activator
MQKYLPDNIMVIPIGYNKLKEKIFSKSWSYFKQTLFVLTTIDISEKVEFNHMNLYNILDSTGENKLNHWLAPYLTEKQLISFNDQLLRFFSKEGISERLSFLNPEVVLKEVETINKKYEDFYNLKLDGKVKLNLYMHIALMIERTMMRKGNSSIVQPKTEKEKIFFKVTRSIFQPVELKYNIQISYYEISLLYELFRQFI